MDGKTRKGRPRDVRVGGGSVAKPRVYPEDIRDALASLHAIGRLMDGYGSDACDRDDVNRLGRLVREIADKGMGHWRVLEDARLKHSTVA